MTQYLRLPPSAQRISVPGGEALVCRQTIAPSHELHIQCGGFGIANLFVLDQHLLEVFGEQLDTCLSLASPDKCRGADLVQDGSCALRRGRIDDVALEGIDDLQLALATIEAQLSGRLNTRDGRRVSNINKGEPRTD